jgi:hypothetical protein
VKRAPLSIDVRVDLFRCAQCFVDAAKIDSVGVLIEPLRRGGVVIVAGDGHDLIVIPDPSGHATRSATIATPGALTKLAVDLFRRDGPDVRFRVDDNTAWIAGDAKGAANREVEINQPPRDWRRQLAPHAHTQLRLPVVGDFRMAQRLRDVANVLARAANQPDALWKLCGGMHGAMLATFPAWPDAVALFDASNEVRDHCADPCSAWRPNEAIYNAPRLAAVGAG